MIKWLEMRLFFGFPTIVGLVLLVLILEQPGLCNFSAVNLILEPKIAWQGKVTAVRIVSAEGISEIKGRFLGQEFECYKEGGNFRGVIGVPINQKAGYYDLNLSIIRDSGSKDNITRKMRVWATKFPFSKLWFRPAKKKLMVQELINQEWAEVEKNLLIEDPIQYWEGRFSLPAEGRISQGFGHRQIINGKRAGSHRGLDIAVPSGTLIKCPNRGKVVFAKELRAFGGTIVIDHGQGIHTLYFHLSKLLAKVGQEVSKGEPLALSGNSGISTGAHLHWGMSVHNLRVDPMQWVNYEI